MEHGLKRFARRILLVHLVLLVALLGIVFVASHEVYVSASRQAHEQAEKQQALLVNQTASGLKGYYDSIFSDLELFKPVDPDDEDADASALAGQAGRLSPTLPQQLNGRVSHLFVVPQGMPSRAQRLGLIQATTPTIPQIVQQNEEWIDEVGVMDKPTISPLQLFADSRGELRGFNLIGVPIVGRSRNFILVATVPVRATARRFFDEVNRTNDTSAFLLDEKMTIMAASKADQIGTRIGQTADPQVSHEVSYLSSQSDGGAEVLEQPFSLGSQTFKASLVAVQPVKVLDKQWYVLMVTPRAEVDAVVGRLFGHAMLWAIFVALSVTAILVSTAVQLIRNRMRVDRERHALLEKELRQAREIQLHWLPTQRAKDPALDIATVNYPASRISGDFYNWFELPDGRTAVVIGDVTGHGMAAAFLMATTQLLVRNTLPQSADPGKCLDEINRQLCTQVFNGQFVTLQILIIDPATGHVEISTAGHPPPLLGDGQRFETLPLEPNLVLGVEKESTYPTEAFDLSPTSTLLLYTDGAFEAESPAGEQFGMERLRRSLGGRMDGAQSLIDAVLVAVNHFRAGKMLGDDLTLVAVQLQPQLAATDRGDFAAVDRGAPESSVV